MNDLSLTRMVKTFGKGTLFSKIRAMTDKVSIHPKYSDTQEKATDLHSNDVISCFSHYFYTLFLFFSLFFSSFA